MKYIRLILFWWLTMIGIVSAQWLELRVNTTELDINNTLQVQVDIDEWIAQWGEVAIQGLDQFEVLGQSRSQNVQIINGQRSWSIQFSIQAKAKETGTYTLWPAYLQIGTGNIQSNELTIEVTGEKLFLNSPPPGVTSQQTTIPTQTNLPVTNNKFTTSWLPLQRLILAGALACILIILWIRRRQKKFISLDTTIAQHSTEEATTQYDLVHSLKPPILPRKNSRNYIEQIDLRMKQIISQQLQKDVSSWSYHEISTERKYVYEDNTKLHEFLQLLQQAQYSKSTVDNDLLHDLAKSWKHSIQQP